MKYGILNIKWSQVHVFNSSTLEADLFELEASLVYILNSRTVENYIVKPYLKKSRWAVVHTFNPRVTEACVSL